MKGYVEETGFSNIMVKERYSKSLEHLNDVIPANAGIHLPHIGLLMCKVELRECFINRFSGSILRTQAADA
jgi:hypothetical protein